MTATVLLARLRDAIQRFGWPGVVGLLLCLLAAAVGLLAAPQMAAGNREFAAETERLAHPVAAPAGRAPGPRYDAADPASALVGQLPPADGFGAFVDALQAQAAAHGVAIDRTEYRIQPVLGNRALRSQLVLPAHGTYPQLRAWLEATLHDFPSSSLQELALRRTGDGSAALEARVVIAFYTRSAK